MMMQKGNAAPLYGRGYQFIDGGTLKIIAALIMLIDHIGASVLLFLPKIIEIPEEYYALWRSTYIISRNIGRSAFIIFCFFIVEGFFHTHDRVKYAMRLFLFALISQYPFELAVFRDYRWQHTNVFFTLLFGLFAIWGMEEAKKRIGNVFLSISAGAVGVAVCCAGAHLLETDYSYRGVMLIVILYVFRTRPIGRSIVGYLYFLWEPYCLPGFLILHLYNGERGKAGKYLFYLFYPAHLFILACIRLWIAWAF